MRSFEHTEFCMGTAFQFQGKTSVAQATLEAALLKACAILHEADAIFSTYKPESPISQLGGGKTSVAQCPEVVSDIWDQCESWNKVTDGWFNAFTEQNTFDPSGLVKSWAARNAAAVLVEASIDDFTMNAGGDILISHGASQVRDWRIGLAKPVSISAPDAGTYAVLDLSSTTFRAVATSGSAERGNHIWNPKVSNRQPSGELLQISVIARDLVEADVWATAAFACGPDALALIDRQPHLEAIGVLANGQIAATPGVQRLIARD